MDKPIKILLVEDNPTDVLLVRAALGAAAGLKFEVATADRLAVALHRANAEPFDLVLLDLGLPDVQGFKTFELAHIGVPNIPIIVLSGLGDDQLAMRAVEQGAQDYLPKARVMEDLLPRAIRYAIERHRAQAERERHAAELRKKNQQLEEELRMAHEMQEALLPHEYPQIFANKHSLHFAHFYQPAAALSGDFFDVWRLSENQAGVLICDVMGHGVQAALLAALIRGLADHFMPVATQPGKFLGAMNHQLSETLKHAGIETYATAFYFVVDLAAGEIHYANAGHPSALILRRDDRTANWLKVDGEYRPPLGLLGSDVTYPEYHAVVRPNDSIVLFTDGLYEAENAAGEPFGHQRLLDAVSRRLDEPCEKLLNDLIHETQQFSGHAEFSDDVCLVGMDVVNGVGISDPPRTAAPYVVGVARHN